MILGNDLPINDSKGTRGNVSPKLLEERRGREGGGATKERAETSDQASPIRVQMKLAGGVNTSCLF